MQKTEKLKVLLVDDEEAYAQVLSKRLTARDFEVSIVFSGEAALERIDQEQFDVVVLDVLMPGMTGIEAFKHIKKLDPEAHVIMLTAHAQLDAAMERMASGAYDYLIKPVLAEELAEKIKLAYNHKKVTEKIDFPE